MSAGQLDASTLRRWAHDAVAALISHTDTGIRRSWRIAPATSHPGTPSVVRLDTAEGLAANARKVYERAVATHSMPLGDETHMTDAERASLGAWIQAGAKAD